MKHVLVVCVVVMVGVFGGVSVASAAVTESPNRNAVALGLFDGLQDFIEQIDQLLEAIVDLLETLQQLFGGGED